MAQKSSLKVVPKPMEYDIVPPDMNYVYFNNSKEHPFEAKNTNFSTTNAWWLSEASFLAYCHPGFARMAFKLAGFDNFKFFHGKGTECMLSWSKKAMILAFRGTELKSISAFHEISSDLDTATVPFEMGGKVHKGFLKGLEEIWSGPDGLEIFLQHLIKENKSIPLWITGHSLGGALAALTFSRLESAKGLYIFGAPRIGDSDFVNLTKDRPIWRFEHGRDPVPMVPPDVPQLNFNFKDMGQLVLITKEGNLLFERPILSAHEEKEKILSTINEQKKRGDNLTKDLFKTVFGGKFSKKVIGEISDHFEQSASEWKEYFTSLDDGIGLKMHDHMIIYYSIKIWNYLVKTEEKRLR